MQPSTIQHHPTMGQLVNKPFGPDAAEASRRSRGGSDMAGLRKAGVPSGERLSFGPLQVSGLAASSVSAAYSAAKNGMHRSQFQTGWTACGCAIASVTSDRRLASQTASTRLHRLMTVLVIASRNCVSHWFPRDTISRRFDLPRTCPIFVPNQTTVHCWSDLKSMM